MFSYQHRYHAGGPADVHKHISLIGILTALCQKPTPFGVLDTHAGEGIYDLHSSEAQKINEHRFGISALLKNSLNDQALLTTYRAIIQHYNPSVNIADKVRYYPGSSAIIQHFLREQDRAYFVEKHPQAFAHLREHCQHDRRIHLHCRDAEEAMLALTPFKEKRGLILIDPSYEIKTEYTSVPQCILQLHKRFSHGIIALWYPILDNGAHHTLLRLIKSFNFISSAIHEYYFQNTAHLHLRGSGMFFINPPWQLLDQLKKIFRNQLNN